MSHIDIYEDFPGWTPGAGRGAPGRRGRAWRAAAIAGAAGVLAIYVFTEFRFSRITDGFSAVGCLKTFVTAEEQYKEREPPHVYVSLTQLSAASPPYVDTVLGGGRMGGYSFRLTVGTPADSVWRATGDPFSREMRRRGRHFFVDQTGVIRFHPGRTATAQDSRIE